MLWQNEQIAAQPCPGCNEQLDCAAPVSSERAVKPGDYSVCIYCGCFLRFGSEMRVRLLTILEVAELPDERRIGLLRMRRTSERFRRERQQ